MTSAMIYVMYAFDLQYFVVVREDEHIDIDIDIDINDKGDKGE